MTSIDLSIPHSHTQAVAWQRLLDCLQAQKNTPTFCAVKVEWLTANVDQEKFTLSSKIRVTILASIVTHTLVFAVTPNQITVTSDPADEWLEPMEMAVERGQIKAMLTEAMK